MQVAVGDHDGVLQVFSVKKQEISHVFKSLPTGPITRLELGGALGTVKDKVGGTNHSIHRAVDHLPP